MPQAKKPSKRKHRACAVPLLGAAGLSLSLASGAPAATVGPAAHEITLGEEEISDVSLATFYVFDKENPSTPGLQLVRHGGCRGYRGCRGCHRGCGGCHTAAEAATEAATAAEAAEVAEVAAAEAAGGCGGAIEAADFFA